MMRTTSPCFLIIYLAVTEFGRAIRGPRCQQWCTTEENLVCSTAYECSIEYHTPKNPLEETRNNIENFEVSEDCLQDQGTIGLMIKWDAKAPHLGSYNEERFHLVIHDRTGHSSFTDIVLSITPNQTTEHFKQMHFEFFYDGQNNIEGPVISGGESYSVTLESVPQRNKSILVSDSHCVETTWTPKSPPIKRVPTIIVVTLCVVIGLLVVVAGVGIAAYKCKKMRDANTAMISERTQNILVLLNVEERAEVAKQTNWAATALSRARGLGHLTVKYNRWETAEIAKIGISQWMQEKISWAHKIVVSSTPDDLRNAETAQIFESSFQTTTMGNFGSSGKTIFVIHFQDEENYKNCPFMNNDNYRKFQLEKEWPSFCRSISATFGTEQEPLQNGSQV